MLGTKWIFSKISMTKRFKQQMTKIPKNYLIKLEEVHLHMFFLRLNNTSGVYFTTGSCIGFPVYDYWM